MLRTPLALAYLQFLGDRAGRVRDCPIRDARKRETPLGGPFRATRLGFGGSRTKSPPKGYLQPSHRASKRLPQAHLVKVAKGMPLFCLGKRQKHEYRREGQRGAVPWMEKILS